MLRLVAVRLPGVAFAFLVLACNSSPTSPEGSGATALIRFGTSAQVTSDVRVSFAQVVEDSRCPATNVCGWAGNAAIRLDIRQDSVTQSVTLNTAGGTGFPRVATLGGHNFTLVDVDPQRQTADPIPMQQYQARIHVSRAD